MSNGKFVRKVKRTNNPDCISFQVAAWMLMWPGPKLRARVLAGQLDPIWRDGKMTFSANVLEAFIWRHNYPHSGPVEKSREYKEFRRRLDLWTNQ